MYQIPKRLSVHEIAEAQAAKEEQAQRLRDQQARAEMQRAFQRTVQVPPVFRDFRPADLPGVPHGYRLVKALENTREVTLKPEPIWTAWHGTSVHNVSQVGRKGLSVQKSRATCLFGAGIYLTRYLPKAMNYGVTSLTYCSDKPILTLLKCRVAMGTILDVDAVRTSFPGERVGSHMVGLDCSWQSVYCGSGTRLEYAHAGFIANEEIVVYDDRQVQVQEIYLFEKTHAIQDIPRRVGQREVQRNRQDLKDRRSQRDTLVKRHLCVQKGQVCRWAAFSALYRDDSYCRRLDRLVSQYPVRMDAYRNMVEKNCNKWSPL
jgi:hypothetical protein